jgi:prevent-host-death family protein
MTSWSVFDAKAKFSEVIDKAIGEGPQVITRRGKPTAVVMSMEAYERQTTPKPDFKEFLRNGPLGDLEIDRSNDGWERDINLPD